MMNAAMFDTAETMARSSLCDVKAGLDALRLSLNTLGTYIERRRFRLPAVDCHSGSSVNVIEVIQSKSTWDVGVEWDEEQPQCNSEVSDVAEERDRPSPTSKRPIRQQVEHKSGHGSNGEVRKWNWHKAIRGQFWHSTENSIGARVKDARKLIWEMEYDLPGTGAGWPFDALKLLSQ